MDTKFPTLKDIKEVYPEYEDDWHQYVWESWHNENPKLVSLIFWDTMNRLRNARVV